MTPTTTNYGLAGGELDATKHLVAAIPRLLTTEESEGLLHREFVAAVTSKIKRESAGSN